MTPDLPAGCVIALLGAGGTGKAELAKGLADRLFQRGIATERVSASRGKQDPASLAAEQTRRIASAAERGVVIADTTALTIAIDADLRSGDTSLYEPALTAHRGYAITLLMALDLPGSANDAAQQTDTLLRAALTRIGAPYAVIHGRGRERLANAWNAINAKAEAAGADSPGDASPGERPWFWPCDKCSDPACEHKLFRDLVARRS